MHPDCNKCNSTIELFEMKNGEKVSLGEFDTNKAILIVIDHSKKDEYQEDIY